jgi:hypothetical protein
VLVEEEEEEEEEGRPEAETFPEASSVAAFAVCYKLGGVVLQTHRKVLPPL